MMHFHHHFAQHIFFSLFRYVSHYHLVWYLFIIPGGIYVIDAKDINVHINNQRHHLNKYKYR